MSWNNKTSHFSPKMRQLMYPDCKTTHKLQNQKCLRVQKFSIWREPIDVSETFKIKEGSSQGGHLAGSYGGEFVPLDFLLLSLQAISLSMCCLSHVGFKSLRGWGPDSGHWGRFMKAVKLFSDPTKTKIYKRLALWSVCVYAYLGRTGNAHFLCVGSST